MTQQLLNLPVMQSLLHHPDPAVVYGARLKVLGETEHSPELRALRQQVYQSPQAQGMLANLRPDGRFDVGHAYQKWQGPLWCLACLAEIGYPWGDAFLFAARDQFYDWLFAPNHFQPPHTVIYPDQPQRVRRCALQEGKAVWFSLILGLEDERTEILVERLKQWQWPDGGWNCDKRREVNMSSLIESVYPMRALALYACLKGDAEARACVTRTAEFILARQIYRRRRDGAVIDPTYTQLSFPYYYQYTILLGLKVLGEAGYLQDERCTDALDLLVSKQLADGGFPLEKRYDVVSEHEISRGSWVDWGPAGKKTSNPWVSIEALSVLRMAGRMV